MFHCEDNDRLELGGGLSMYLDEQDQQPELAEMSAAFRIEEIPIAGASMELLDETESEDILAAWNEEQGPTTGCECRASRRRMHGAGWLGLLLLIGLRARGRRR